MEKTMEIKGMMCGHCEARVKKTLEAIARGQNRALLVMATGTGKTFTAFQIIWRLWKAGRKNASCFSLTAIFWSIKPKTTTSSLLARP